MHTHLSPFDNFQNISFLTGIIYCYKVGSWRTCYKKLKLVCIGIRR